MTNFIDVQRRFLELTESELKDSEQLVSWSETEFGPDVGWTDLLQHARIVLLAEAGAGKTIEMREQASRLAEDGRFAFFIPLEALDRKPVVDLLSPPEEARFGRWKANRREPAWFFLDAVDELKLTEGKLDQALNRLAKDIDGHLARARVVVSCRPSDWRPGSDLDAVQVRLPVPERRGETSSRPPDEVFIEALRRDHHGTARVAAENEESSSKGPPRTFAMLPMSDGQIKEFAVQCSVTDASAFLAEIARQNVWIFARRPLDLTELVMVWNDLGHLGTRVEQHEKSVTAKLKDNPERPDRGVLADGKVRTGAERLALALALTRTRTIRSPAQTLEIHRADGVLDPSKILPDWTEAERQALLRRALFDPATYGRVRFHHRSVQEYLAARRLLALHERGMSRKALFRLLFADRYGVEVVLPSMRGIAAWLALGVDSVRKELIRREPETLVSYGDPGSLDLAARSDLLHAFVAEHGDGDWRGLRTEVDDARRLAHPELAAAIRACWGNGPENGEVRELLVEMIWQGPVEACGDLAHDVALDTKASAYLRIVAILALVACGWKESVRALADAILVEPDSWPDRIVHGVAEHLYPEIIATDELVGLMERTRERKDAMGGFGWASRKIVEAVEPASDLGFELRDKLADLIWRGRAKESEPYRIFGKYDYLAPALALLCDRQLTESPRRSELGLIRACVVASRFGRDETDGRAPVHKLRAHFDIDAMLRCEAFWAELAFMDEVAPAGDDWQRFWQAKDEGIVDVLTEADRPWLETALSDERHPERHAVALYALIDCWYRRGRARSELDAIRTRLKGDTTLARILEERTAPPKRDERLEKMERDRQHTKQDRIRHEEQRLTTWKQWHSELLANPANAFSATKRAETVSNIYAWLAATMEGRNRYDTWDKNALISAFGPDVATRAEDAFRALWRTSAPVLWSARSTTNRNVIRNGWIFGLTGVHAEAEVPRWTESLSSPEARTAAAYATIELDGFAPFITALAASHPEEVSEVMGGEVSAELSLGGDHDHLPALQNLAYADGNLKKLLITRLLAELKSWPRALTGDTTTRWAAHLNRVLRILNVADSEADRAAIAQECVDRLDAEPSGALALEWLRGLFMFDAVRGTQALLDGLADRYDSGTRERAIKTFSALFGDHGAIGFEIADPALRARHLGQLVRHAYAFVRWEDDQVHEGVYTPNTRDKAETARNFLLDKLLDTPGPGACRVVLELADGEDFAHFPDRLRHLARERAAADAEFPAFESEDVIALDTRHEAPPRDRDSLFAVMMDRLCDLAHDLHHHDFSDRCTVQAIAEESEMQRTIALRIEAKSNGAYSVMREEQVADGKRTDIRISTANGDQKAVMEVKIADNGWSLSDLQRSLRDQLVGQYLRHSNCKAGCLLLTYRGTKHYWVHSDTGKHLEFSEIVEILRDQAASLEKESSHDVRIAVFGLDLTDPPLAAVHRKRFRSRDRVRPAADP